MNGNLLHGPPSMQVLVCQVFWNVLPAVIVGLTFECSQTGCHL